MARAAGNKKCPPIFEPLVRYSVRLVLLALGGVFVMSASLVDECYRRAGDARRSAEMASMPSQKTHFLELEQRWLRAASCLAPESPPEASAGPKNRKDRNRRPSKFTPQAIEQIGDWVALGKSREEIAGLLGVTVGTLQVACSKRGISLRRPKFRAGSNLLAHEDPYTAGSISSPVRVNSVRFDFEQVDELLRGTQQNEAAAPRADEIGRQQVEAATLALTMHLRGRERTVPLHLPTKVITALALESQLREMSLGELIGEIVAGALADGLSGLLDGDLPRADAA